MPDTIVALSSPAPALEGGTERILQRAIVRLSGSRAFEFADAVFKISVPEKRRAAKDVQPVFASVAASGLQRRWRRLAGAVDFLGAHALPAHAYVMPGPRSYTREDVVELHVPALPWLLDGLLDALVKLGARVAQPGEFTRRAFENGRLSLEQAEAVGRLISSSTAAEARAYAQRLTSHVESDRQKLKAGLEDLLAQVELGLDFAHEDVVVIPLDEIARRIGELKTRAEKLADEAAREAGQLTAGALSRVVLAGPTNAGKSKLFNALLGRDAAIVSAERHTTRDAVEAVVHFKSKDSACDALLIDSAGLGDVETPGPQNALHPSNVLYAAALNATQRAIRSADVLLIAVDSSVPAQAQEGLVPLCEFIAGYPELERVLVWTKSDLPPAPANSQAEICNLQSEIIRVSALNGDGMKELRAHLAARCAEISSRSATAHAASSGVLRSSARAAAEALSRAAEALRDKSGEDALAVELREAIHACWQAEGVLVRHDAVTEGALDRIFAQFCIGK